IAPDVSSLESSLSELQERASFTELEADIINLDSTLNHALNLLESARDKGYKFDKDLEEIAYQAMSRWQEVRGDVEKNIQQQANLMQKSLNPVDQQVQRLNASLGNPAAANPLLNSVQSEVDRILDTIGDAEDKIEKVYAKIESQASTLTSRLTRIHWALNQVDEASFELKKDEDLVRAVAARWDKEGKEDPEGVLYLTTKRVLFEQKEKIATKKVLFITTASELVQQLLGEQKLDDVKVTKAHSKGLFGHQDFLDVDFADGKLGKVSFHLSGQDSEDWARLIADAKSGKIEEDRTSGTGLSFTDLTGKLTSADIMELQNEVNELQDEMMLQDTRGELADLENEVRSLERDLTGLRGRGYAVEKSLEADIQVLAVQWDRIKSRAEITLEHQTKLLGEHMSAIQKEMSNLAGMTANLAAARPVYVRLKSAIASAEAQAEAAEDTVLDQYEEYADEVEALSAHFDWVDWMLDAISTASFKLLASESGVAAVEAVWQRPGLEPLNGILFLTDQRLLWEDRSGDFEVKIDIAVNQVDDIKEQEDEESGEQSLVIKFKSGGPLPKVLLTLAQPVGEEWCQMVGRASAGDYAQDRAIEIDESLMERIRNAPEQCSNCGAAFTAPVLRGQTDISCEFCGVVTRI
ncbi:MAG: hypothetical protein OEZ02_14735, partial [Anaerolineae bacterium]|nr:hypothetical protein [Anaerolineae bacterium]